MRHIKPKRRHQLPPIESIPVHGTRLVSRRWHRGCFVSAGAQTLSAHKMFCLNRTLNRRVAVIQAASRTSKQCDEPYDGDTEKRHPNNDCTQDNDTSVGRKTRTKQSRARQRPFSRRVEEEGQGAALRKRDREKRKRKVKRKKMPLTKVSVAKVKRASIRMSGNVRFCASRGEDQPSEKYHTQITGTHEYEWENDGRFVLVCLRRPAGVIFVGYLKQAHHLGVIHEAVERRPRKSPPVLRELLYPAASRHPNPAPTSLGVPLLPQSHPSAVPG